MPPGAPVPVSPLSITLSAYALVLLVIHQHIRSRHAPDSEQQRGLAAPPGSRGPLEPRPGPPALVGLAGSHPRPATLGLERR